MRARRVLPAITIAALALGMISLPASAAGSTRWVDDDGKAGPAGCAGSAVAKKTITAAVAAANARDTILVCPGVYDEPITIGAAKDGLTIRGVKPWTARVERAADENDPVSQLLLIKNGARNVTIQGLAFIWRVADVRAAGFGECALRAGIVVEGQNATILGNRVRAKGATFSPCGMVDGIVVGDPIDTRTAGNTPAASATVSHNLVQDFVIHGITATGGGSSTVTRNSVRYWHLDTRFLRRSPVRGLASDGWSGVRPAGPAFESMGIAVGLGATGEIHGNEVSSGPDAEIIFPNAAGQGGSTPGLFYGITSADTTGLVTRDNTVRRTAVGISYFGVDSGRISANTVIDHVQGIALGGADDNRVAANQVGPGEVGIAVDALFIVGSSSGSDGNQIINNTSFGHEVDCLDVTSGGGTLGTANTWEGNAGANSSPTGLCLAID